MAEKTKTEIIEMLQQLILEQEQMYLRSIDVLAEVNFYVNSSHDLRAEQTEMGLAHDRGEI